MAAEAQHTCYEGDNVHIFQFYLEHSGEHKAIVQCVNNLLAREFKRYSRKWNAWSNNPYSKLRVGDRLLMQHYSNDCTQGLECENFDVSCICVLHLSTVDALYRLKFHHSMVSASLWKVVWAFNHLVSQA